jgi:hypothetical protein
VAVVNTNKDSPRLVGVMWDILSAQRYRLLTASRSHTQVGRDLNASELDSAESEIEELRQAVHIYEADGTNRCDTEKVAASLPWALPARSAPDSIHPVSWR